MRQSVLTCVITDPAPEPNDSFGNLSDCGQMSDQLNHALHEFRLFDYGQVHHAAVTSGETNTILVTIVTRTYDNLSIYANVVSAFVNQYEWGVRAKTSDFHVETASHNQIIVPRVVPATEEPVPVLTRNQLDEIVRATQAPTRIPGKDLAIGDVCIPDNLPLGLNIHIADSRTPCYVTAVRDNHIRLTYHLVIDDRPFTVAAWIHITQQVLVHRPSPPKGASSSS